MAHSYEEIEKIAAGLRPRCPQPLQVGIITGSGLGGLATAMEKATTIPYQEIPHFPHPTVDGHAGQLVLGWLAGKGVFLMQGRAHYHEGYSLEEVTLPVRVMRALGAEMLIVTNAAGGLNPRFRPGDLMLISDHINFLGMAGHNPLRGQADPRLGPRFPPLAGVYDPGLIKIARAVGEDLDIRLRRGIYIMLSGPTYETEAEVRLLRLWGGDAVGMSTVPEVVVARHGGMRILGISVITNPAGKSQSRRPPQDLHQEVIAAGDKALQKLIPLIKGILKRI